MVEQTLTSFGDHVLTFLSAFPDLLSIVNSYLSIFNLYTMASALVIGFGIATTAFLVGILAHPESSIGINCL